MKSGFLNMLLVLIVFCLSAPRSEGQKRYPLQLHCSGKDSVLLLQQVGMPLSFANGEACSSYIRDLPQKLKKLGYMTVSIDSLAFDSAYAYLEIFVGDRYQWGALETRTVDPSLLSAVVKNIPTLFDPEALTAMREKLYARLANNGYPFATVTIDSIRFSDTEVYGILKVDSGRYYTIDSIRVFGELNLKNRYLQKYLQIPNGTAYSQEKLAAIRKRLAELPFLQETGPWQLSMLGTGAVLDLYLAPRRSSQVDVLIGFLPGNENAPGGRKFLLTGEANVQLKNALQNGESIGFNWQQLMPQSPRLNLSYGHPYILNTHLGLDLAFDLYKKDSAYLNLTARAGIEYLADPDRTGKVFMQTFRTNLLTVDTAAVRFSRRLPDQIDLSVNIIGVSFRFSQTDYKFNPRKGTEGELTLTAGQKKIRKNNAIADLKSVDFDYSSLYDSLKLNSYQLMARGSFAHYLPLGRQAAMKTAVNAGILESPEIFRNELFQIGGYRLLRGFDEQSLFVSGYAVLTAEYRYLIGQNSYLSAFADGALTHDKSRSSTLSRTASYLGIGMGMAFETKAGIFNMALAVGKSNAQSLGFRQSKIHFGYVNYF